MNVILIIDLKDIFCQKVESIVANVLLNDLIEKKSSLKVVVKQKKIILIRYEMQNFMQFI
jgi:isochorismate hydrolase